MCYPRPTCSSPSSSSKTRPSLKAIHERIKAGCQVSGWRNPINTIYCSPSFYATESFLIQRFFCLDGLPVGDEDPKGLYRDSFEVNIFRLWRTSFVRSRTAFDKAKLLVQKARTQSAGDRPCGRSTINILPLLGLPSL